MESVWQNHKMSLIALAVLVVAALSTVIVVPRSAVSREPKLRRPSS